MNHMDSDLYLALFDDKIDVLKGMNWLEVRDQLTPSNDTVLHVACHNGSIKCVEEILSVQESLLLQTNSRGKTALHLAARHGHCGAIEALIKKAKSMVPQPSNLENTSATVLQNLIRARNMEHETALHVAVSHNQEKVVELLVKEDPSYSYPRNKFNETPLYMAAVRCYEGVTKVILDNCESPAYGGPDGRTALHATLMNEQGSGCMKLLLEKNNDLIKVADDNGWTAFHYAAHNNLYESVEFLINVDKSAVYLADKKHKRTAIHVAAYKGHMMVLEVLLKYMPDAWESADTNGQNILHISVMQNQKSVIEFILSNDTSGLASHRDSDGNTPLHLIGKFEIYFPFLQYIDEWNADWNAANNANFTPIDMLWQKQTGIHSQEARGGVTVDRTGVRDHWNRWIEDKAREEEVQLLSPAALESQLPSEDKLKIARGVANANMIVAALITTVSLTAGFAMPGGFDGNQGPNQGSAVLSRKTSFKIFMMADTYALILSLVSLVLFFLIQFNITERVLHSTLSIAMGFNFGSIIAMVVAFMAGTSAVLSHTSYLTIRICIIAVISSVIAIYVSFRFLPNLYRYINKRYVITGNHNI